MISTADPQATHESNPPDSTLMAASSTITNAGDNPTKSRKEQKTNGKNMDAQLTRRQHRAPLGAAC
jgi:hypothetical protein